MRRQRATSISAPKIYLFKLHLPKHHRFIARGHIGAIQLHFQKLFHSCCQMTFNFLTDGIFKNCKYICQLTVTFRSELNRYANFHEYVKINVNYNFHVLSFSSIFLIIQDQNFVKFLRTNLLSTKLRKFWRHSTARQIREMPLISFSRSVSVASAPKLIDRPRAPLRRSRRVKL